MTHRVLKSYKYKMNVILYTCIYTYIYIYMHIILTVEDLRQNVLSKNVFSLS